MDAFLVVIGGNISKSPSPLLQYLGRLALPMGTFHETIVCILKLHTTITVYMNVCTYHMFYVLFTCSEKNAGCNSSQSEDKNRGNKFSNSQSITSLTPTRVTCIWIEKISCSNNVPVKFLVVAKDLINFAFFDGVSSQTHIYLVALP